MEASTESASTGLLADWRVRHSSTLTETRHNLRVFLRDKLAVVGVAWILFMVFVAVGAPWIAPYPEEGRGRSNLSHRFEAPSSAHPFGTDNLGRDVLSRVIFGARIPLMISALVAAAVLIIGPVMGGLAGYYGGLLDEVIMRITDIFLAFPALILAMAFVAILGPSLQNLALALIITWWPWYTRLVRGQAISLRQRPYVEAAKTMGVSNRTIVLASHPAQRLRPGHRGDHARPRYGDPRGSRPLLPRSRRQAADAGVGAYGLRGRGVRPRAVVDQHLPRDRHLPAGAGVQRRG